MEDKQFYDYIDIMRIFQCGRDRAFSIIRSVKSVSDIAGLSGKVTKTDYIAWYNAPLENYHHKTLVTNDIQYKKEEK